MHSALSLTATKGNVLCQVSKRVRFTTSSHVILLTWADNEHCSKLRDLWLNSTPITPDTSDASLALNRFYDIHIPFTVVVRGNAKLNIALVISTYELVSCIKQLQLLYVIGLNVDLKLVGLKLKMAVTWFYLIRKTLTEVTN